MQTVHSWSVDCDEIDRSGPTTRARLCPEAADVAATTGASVTGHIHVTELHGYLTILSMLLVYFNKHFVGSSCSRLVYFAGF